MWKWRLVEEKKVPELTFASSINARYVIYCATRALAACTRARTISTDVTTRTPACALPPIARTQGVRADQGFIPLPSRFSSEDFLFLPSSHVCLPLTVSTGSRPPPTPAPARPNSTVRGTGDVGGETASCVHMQRATNTPPTFIAWPTTHAQNSSSLFDLIR